MFVNDQTPGLQETADQSQCLSQQTEDRNVAG